jgi:hypothetical protein
VNTPASCSPGSETSSKADGSRAVLPRHSCIGRSTRHRLKRPGPRWARQGRQRDACGRGRLRGRARSQDSWSGPEPSHARRSPATLRTTAMAMPMTQNASNGAGRGQPLGACPGSDPAENGRLGSFRLRLPVRPPGRPPRLPALQVGRSARTVGATERHMANI